MDCDCKSASECKYARVRDRGGRLFDICSGQSDVAREKQEMYVARWSGVVEQSLSNRTGRRRTSVCIYHGDEIRREVCKTCQGTVKVKVFSCKIHGECTIGKKLKSTECCKSCNEYTVPKEREKSNQWAYGVTTIPSRRHDLLPCTLASLATAGFDKPHLFVDGCSDTHLYDDFGLQVTLRYPKVRTAANWVLSLWELYLRAPNSDWYAIFQDDFVTCLNLRSYLEQCRYLEKGYLNLYTSAYNEKLSNRPYGWYEVNKQGISATALVFNQKTVKLLLSSNLMINRFQNERTSWRKIDAGISKALSQAGIKEYIHIPSLVQHCGLKSSMGTPELDLSKTFQGEEFDCLTLLPLQLPITVVIPIAGNCIDLITSCINTLVTDINEVPLQKIIVIANGVSKETLKITKEILKLTNIKTKLIVNKENIGFTKAVNIGIIAAEQSHILILNSDCQLAPNALRLMYHVINSNHVVAAVNPITNDGGCCSLHRQTHLKQSRLNVIPKNPIDLQQISTDIYQEKTTVMSMLSFFCTLLNHYALNEVGLLNTCEEFSSGLGVDDDWCNRAISNGWKLMLHHGAFADHIGGETFRRMNIDRKTLARLAMKKIRIG